MVAQLKRRDKVWSVSIKRETEDLILNYTRAVYNSRVTFNEDELAVL
jgi:hypothetical protein